MEEVILALIGLGVVATSPRVPVLRGITKAIIKTGMAVAGAAVAVAVLTEKRVNDLAGHAGADHAIETIADASNETAGAASIHPSSFDNADLLQIDGIGPKVSGHLRNAGIENITQLAAAQVERLQEILDAAGPRFGAIDSSSWPEQAQALLGGRRA
jgi:large subunit ribosomal protein L17